MFHLPSRSAKVACWKQLAGQFFSANRFPRSPNALHFESIKSCRDPSLFHPQHLPLIMEDFAEEYLARPEYQTITELVQDPDRLCSRIGCIWLPMARHIQLRDVCVR